MSRLCSPEKVEWMEKIWSSFTLLTKDWLISILFGLFLVNLRSPLCRVRNGCLFRLLIVKSFSNSFASMICRPSLMIVMYYNSLIKITLIGLLGTALGLSGRVSRLRRTKSKDDCILHWSPGLIHRLERVKQMSCGWLQVGENQSFQDLHNITCQSE